MSVYSKNIPTNIEGAIDWVLPYLKPGKIFLDVGCSTGYFGKYIKHSSQLKVYGVEISKDVQEAKKVLDGVYSFDLDAPWPPKIYEREYDYIFFGDVLEHLKTPESALEQAKRLLKPNGKVFVSIPNIAHMSVRLELVQGNFMYEPMGILDNTHLKYFTLDSFKKLANDAGYKVEAIDYSLDEYPDKVIADILAKAGLKPNNTFWKQANQTTARAFQYKFVLAPGKPPKTTPEPPKPVQARNHYNDDLLSKVEALDAHTKKQAEIITFREAEIKLVRHELNTANTRLNKINNTPPVKLLRAIKRLGRRLKA